MSTKVFDLVDAAPFSGKFTIRDSIKSYVEAEEENEEKRKYIGTNAFLIGMVAAHAYQAYLGYNSLENHITYSTLVEADPLAVVGATIDAAYLSANALVTARQTHLLKRVNDVRRKKKERRTRIAAEPTVPESTTEEKEEKSIRRRGESSRDKRVLGAVAFTLAGQALFMGSYIHASFEERTSECVESTQAFYDEYVQEHPNLQESLQSKEEYVKASCE